MTNIYSFLRIWSKSATKSSAQISSLKVINCGKYLVKGYILVLRYCGVKGLSMTFLRMFSEVALEVGSPFHKSQIFLCVNFKLSNVISDD